MVAADSQARRGGESIEMKESQRLGIYFFARIEFFFWETLPLDFAKISFYGFVLDSSDLVSFVDKRIVSWNAIYSHLFHISLFQCFSVNDLYQQSCDYAMSTLDDFSNTSGTEDF